MAAQEQHVDWPAQPAPNLQLYVDATSPSAADAAATASAAASAAGDGMNISSGIDGVRIPIVSWGSWKPIQGFPANWETHGAFGASPLGLMARFVYDPTVQGTPDNLGKYIATQLNPSPSIVDLFYVDIFVSNGDLRIACTLSSRKLNICLDRWGGTFGGQFLGDISLGVATLLPTRKDIIEYIRYTISRDGLGEQIKFILDEPGRGIRYFFDYYQKRDVPVQGAGVHADGYNIHSIFGLRLTFLNLQGDSATEVTGYPVTTAPNVYFPQPTIPFRLQVCGEISLQDNVLLHQTPQSRGHQEPEVEWASATIRGTQPGSQIPKLLPVIMPASAGTNPSTTDRRFLRHWVAHMTTAEQIDAWRYVTGGNGGGAVPGINGIPLNYFSTGLASQHDPLAYLCDAYTNSNPVNLTIMDKIRNCMEKNPALKSWLDDRITTMFLQPVQRLTALAQAPASIAPQTMQIIKERIFRLGKSSDLSVMQPFSPTDQHADSRWRTESVCLTYSLYLMGQLQYEWLDGGNAVRRLLTSSECGVGQWNDIMGKLGEQSFVWPSLLIVGVPGQIAADLAVQGHTGVGVPRAPAPPAQPWVPPLTSGAGGGYRNPNAAAEEMEEGVPLLPMHPPCRKRCSRWHTTRHLSIGLGVELAGSTSR